MGLADRIGEAFLLALRIASPFVVFAFLANFALGVMNKLAQQIPIYFVALPRGALRRPHGVLLRRRRVPGAVHRGFADWLRVG